MNTCDRSRSELVLESDAGDLLGLSPALIRRVLDEGRTPSVRTEAGRAVRRTHLDSYLRERDAVTEALEQARRDRPSIGDRLAAKHGLTPEQARRLGLH